MPDNFSFQNADPEVADAVPGVLEREISPLEATGAHWIAPSRAPEGAPVLRGTVELPGRPGRAELLVAGLGLHAVRVNGTSVAQGALEPAISNPRRVVWYSRLAVTDLLGTGTNTVEVTLGAGFCAMTTPNAWRWEQAPWRGPRMLIAALLADGVTVAVSDTDWRWGEGPVRFDSMYEGQSYDARMAGAPVDSPVTVAERPGGRLAERRHEPVAPGAQIAPAWRPCARGWLGDAGRVIAGVACYDLDLAEGNRVRIRFGETLDADGELVCSNEHVYTGRFQTDEIIGVGGRVRWFPEFAYQGFRYLEVEGLEHRPGPGEIVAVPLEQQVAPASTFACDVPLFNDLVELTRRTVLNNLHHIPTDTPCYEKNGWTGDILVSLDTLTGLFDLHRLLVKWIEDIVSTQLPDGSLSVIAPSPGWGYRDGECAPAPEWTCVLPALLVHLAGVYGDPQPAREHWGACRAYLDHELSRLHDGLAGSELGDYLAPGYPLGPPPEDSRLSASCFLFRALGQGVELAAMNGDDDAARRFRGAAARLRGRINETFLDRHDGCYRTASDPPDERNGGYRQTSNLMPVAFGIVPDQDREQVVATIIDDVVARGHHLNTGHIGTSLLLNVLTDAGRADEAFTVATGTDEPSWGHWLQLGATSMWERWDAGARSHDHFFLATVTDWILTRVAGVQRIGGDWSRVRVAPGLVPGVNRAASTRRTPLGDLVVEWERGGPVHLVVPQGMTCELGGENPATLGPGDHRL